MKLAILLGAAEIALAVVAISGVWWNADPFLNSEDDSFPFLLYAAPFFVVTIGLWIAASLGGVLGGAVVLGRIARYLGQDLPRLFKARS
jgi:hypothetical protein